MKSYSRSHKGFTLIELLVVVAIVSLLSSVILASLNKARAKARDAKRKSDITQIYNALQLNYDKYGKYTQPENMGSDCSNGADAECGTKTDWGPSSDLRDLVTDKFLPSLPVDPLNDSTHYYYYEPWNDSSGECLGKGGAGCAFTLCARLLESGGSFCKSVSPS